MKFKYLIVILIAWFGLSNVGPMPLQAAPAEASRPTGTVIGRVRNVVTGQYLNMARVSIPGTENIAFTDAFGIFRLVNVPSGSVELEVFYTDLDLHRMSLQVPDGGTLEQDVGLTSQARYGQNQSVVALDAFRVAADRETDAQAIATNEQRFAPNIKNVMSTDSLGDTLGSSVGEFLKFIPGITAEFDNAEIAGISIRGIGGDMTSVTTDGAPASSVWWSQATRSVDIRSIALNDISRIEVTKVPTPSTPADSLGGSVNMVSKSSFERSGALLRYGINLVGNSGNVTFKKTPHSYRDRNTHKLLPGFNFDYTLPIGKNFGIVVSGMTGTVFNEQQYSTKLWASAGTGIASSVARPYLQSYYVLDGPTNITRNTLGLKADWRVTPHSVLSLGLQVNRAETQIGSMQMTFNAGANGTPSVANGVAFSHGEDFTIGATGRGTVTNNGTNQLVDQETDAANLNYRYDDGKWRIEAGLSHSATVTKRRQEDAGIFFQVMGTNRTPVRVAFLDIAGDQLGAIQLFDNANQPVDFYDIESFRGTTTKIVQGRNKSKFDSGNLHLRRRLDFLPFPSSIQIGGLRREQIVDIKLENTDRTFNGPNNNPLASLAPYTMQVYKNQDSGFGFKNVRWLSPRQAWDAFEANPNLYVQTPAQLVTSEDYRRTNSERAQETVSSLYFQAEASLFKSRLKVLTGVRYEKTVDEGVGSLFDPNAVFVRNANGAFARDALGRQIRKPEAGLVNSIEQLNLTRQERAAHGYRAYDGYYPSLHLTYDLKENFLARVSYARTYGRPNFTDIIPRTSISERDLTEEQLNDPTVLKGTLTVRNTSLLPWTADNYDLSLEYYTQQGGLISAGVFIKEIENFFGNEVRFATLADLEEVGLDPDYVGWNLSTKFNSGDAQIKGAEFNFKHSLRALGRIGSYFTVFANATKLKLLGNQGASFQSFIPESGNWGASFNRKQVTVTARWNYRGLDKRGAQPAFGPDGFQYIKARTTMDMYIGYQLTRRLALAASINNVLSVPQTILRYGSETPEYARHMQTAKFGVRFGLGLKGTY